MLAMVSKLIFKIECDKIQWKSRNYLSAEYRKLLDINSINTILCNERDLDVSPDVTVIFI